MTAIPASSVAVRTMADPDLYARLMQKGAKKEDGCIEWTSCKLPNGYGAIQYKRKKLSANRAMWKSIHGELPPDIYVCHKCDNKACINPEHLFPGTAADNNKDRANKGRSFRPGGELNPMSKFSEEKIKEILGLCTPGVPMRDLAARFGCSVASIRTWAKSRGQEIGRSGERNGRHILDSEKVKEIKKRLLAGESQMSISRLFGVSGHSIWRIANGKGWK